MDTTKPSSGRNLAGGLLPNSASQASSAAISATLLLHCAMAAICSHSESVFHRLSGYFLWFFSYVFGYRDPRHIHRATFDLLQTMEGNQNPISQPPLRSGERNLVFLQGL